jgi:hypothetical protein
MGLDHEPAPEQKGQIVKACRSGAENNPATLLVGRAEREFLKTYFQMTAESPDVVFGQRRALPCLKSANRPLRALDDLGELSLRNVLCQTHATKLGVNCSDTGHRRIFARHRGFGK